MTQSILQTPFLSLLLNVHPKAHEIVEALEKISNPKALATLNQVELRSPSYEIAKAIATIQNRCKYYNYEIAHGLPPHSSSQSHPTDRD